MRFSNNLGAILLGIWLILTGLIGLGVLNVPGTGTIMAILALAAGIVLLFPVAGRGTKAAAMASLPRIGALLLAVWLVLTGLFALTNITFPESGMVMALLALVAGALMLLGR